jgi:hypothetical protein
MHSIARNALVACPLYVFFIKRYLIVAQIMFSIVLIFRVLNITNYTLEWLQTKE